VPLQPAASADARQAGGASLIACIPFRGRNIFHRNSFVDTGAHQLYGIGLDTIVPFFLGVIITDTFIE
jgi:hypothetical protein